MRFTLLLCNQSGLFAWQKCLQMYNFIYLAVLNILSQPEKENFLSFPRLSLFGKAYLENDNQKKIFRKPSSAEIPPLHFTRCNFLPMLLRELIYHNILQHFALLLIKHRSDGGLILCKGTSCATSLSPCSPSPSSDPSPSWRVFRSQSQTAPLWYLPVVHSVSPSPVAFVASDDCDLCVSMSGTQCFWGSRCKVCCSRACRLELVLYFCYELAHVSFCFLIPSA